MTINGTKKYHIYAETELSRAGEDYPTLMEGYIEKPHVRSKILELRERHKGFPIRARRAPRDYTIEEKNRVLDIMFTNYEDEYQQSYWYLVDSKFIDQEHISTDTLFYQVLSDWPDVVRDIVG